MSTDVYFDKPKQILYFYEGVLVDLEKRIAFIQPSMKAQYCISYAELMQELQITDEDIKRAIDYSLVNAVPVVDVSLSIGPKLCSKDSEFNPWTSFVRRLRNLCVEKLGLEKSYHLNLNSYKYGTKLLQAMVQNNRIDMLHLEKSLQYTLVQQMSGLVDVSSVDLSVNKQVINDMACDLAITIIKES